MSQWKVREDLEFEVQMDDADFQEKYETAFNNMGEAEKNLQKVGRLSDITKGYCEMFYNLFDDIFGAGSGETIFQGRKNASLCNEVYDSFISHCSAEAKRILAANQKMVNKYKPKKGRK